MMTELETHQIQEISTHAVNMYIERILGLDPNMASRKTRRYCRNRIKDTILRPEIIYNKEREEGGCPIHIRGGIAIPVRPAEEDPEKVVVPTTYTKETYL